MPASDLSRIQLSLSLKKSFILPKKIEFIGNNVCPDGNCPAQSKHDLLSTQPKPEIVRNVPKFIRFAQFYSIYLHHFELRITPLRKLTMKFDYTELVVPHWTNEAEKAFSNIQFAILADPCLMRFNHQRLVVLCTNFSLVGFGFVVCQPGTDVASEAAMVAYHAGKDFSFMTKESSAALLSVAFGSCKCCGNKTRLHSHLGKGFSGNWAINKNKHMLFGT
jgi:hypothetical protein